MKTPPDIGDGCRVEPLCNWTLGTLSNAGLLGRWRPISGHLRHACLADRVIYRLRQSSRNWLGTRLAIIPSPS
jgi:hypothetical protein